VNGRYKRRSPWGAFLKPKIKEVGDEEVLANHSQLSLSPFKFWAGKHAKANIV
jgi:hypothetical protein